VSAIEARILLPGDVTTPAAARRFVRAALESVEADPVVIETAELLTDELVTNAIVHADSKSHLFIRAVKGVVRVEITDPDDRLPTMAVPNPDALGGRGLVIVNGLASAWGVEPTTEGGKTVWFELSPLSHHALGGVPTVAGRKPTVAGYRGGAGPSAEPSRPAGSSRTISPPSGGDRDDAP
jgi:anti-sigma regulatory factor (Ser/Thr protein kinase)